jgi:predicted lipoprotein with Yx(FWY)xxD motif
VDLRRPAPQGQLICKQLTRRCTRSACYGGCAKAWPALTAKGEPTAGEGLQSSLLGTTTRTDGTTQVTYKGMPLYHFAGDTKPSDTNGQGLNKVWWVVAPDGSLVKSAP